MYDQLLVGKILKAHGLKGEVKVQAYADDLERMKQLKEVTLETAEGLVLDSLRVLRARVAGREVFLSLQNVDTRAKAEALRGRFLSVPREKAQKLSENSWYVCDLVGLKAFDRDLPLGRVKEVLDTGHQDLLVIEDTGKADLYVPFRKAWLIAVDLQEQSLVLDLPEGLLELYRP